MGVQIFCQIVDDPGCMALILGEKNLVFDLLFFQDGFDGFPDRGTKSGSGVRIYEKGIHAILLFLS